VKSVKFKLIGTILLAIPGFVLLWVLITYVEHLISMRKYPKGPFPLPLLGNLKLLGKKPFLDFIKLSKTYGDVFSMSFGMKRVVVINSYEAIKEALVTRGHDFAGRPNDNIPLGIQTNNFQDLATKDYSKSWSFLRKLTYKSLHFYGTGIKNVEDLVMEDVEEMVSLLSKEVGNPILIHKYFGNTSINTINNICFSKRYLPTDPEFLDILRFSHHLNLGCAPGQLIT
uniref:Uncharacterized protein n=1 Tax=Clytia hemisphaerica TaxID=252671 RepID=A0A7M5WTC6_9CNID